MDQRRTDASDASTGLVPAREPTSREPALQFQSRPVFVIVGMHRSGAAVLAKMLQLLGVDMAETGGGDDDLRWERPEIVAFNDRLLDLIGRPLDSAVHALPFPAGWWGDAGVLALKREVQVYLRATLADRYGMWGFKDLRVTRLLPFWQQVFDEMGLRPTYLWAVRDPAECAASAVASGLVVNAGIAEAMWFIYNADVHKFIGDEAVAIVDYAAWADAPAPIVDALLDRLPLSWRGSQGELLECVRAITASRRPSTASPIQSPLVQRFYEAIIDPERTERSLRYRGSVAQAVDILRTLVSPYAALVGAADRPAELPGSTAPDHAATADRDAQGRVNAAVARAEAAEAAIRDTEEILTREIEARVSENMWLQQQYLEGKRALAEQGDSARQAIQAAEAETARLRRELGTVAAASHEDPHGTAKAPDHLDPEYALVKDELEQARKELTLQKAANERYLSRIYELKGSRKTARTGNGAPPATAA